MWQGQKGANANNERSMTKLEELIHKMTNRHYKLKFVYLLEFISYAKSHITNNCKYCCNLHALIIIHKQGNVKGNNDNLHSYNQQSNGKGHDVPCTWKRHILPCTSHHSYHQWCCQDPGAGGSIFLTSINKFHFINQGPNTHSKQLYTHHISRVVENSLNHVFKGRTKTIQ